MVDAIRGPPRRNRSRKFPTFYDPPLFCASLLSALAGHFLRSRNRPKAVIRIPFAAAGLRGLRYTGHGGCLRSSYTSDCHFHASLQRFGSSLLPEPSQSASFPSAPFVLTLRPYNSLAVTCFRRVRSQLAWTHRRRQRQRPRHVIRTAASGKTLSDKRQTSVSGSGSSEIHLNLFQEVLGQEQREGGRVASRGSLATVTASDKLTHRLYRIIDCNPHNFTFAPEGEQYGGYSPADLPRSTSSYSNTLL
jgi:hypothetical protein